MWSKSVLAVFVFAAAIFCSFSPTGAQNAILQNYAFSTNCLHYIGSPGNGGSLEVTPCDIKKYDQWVSPFNVPFWMNMSTTPSAIRFLNPPPNDQSLTVDSGATYNGATVNTYQYTSGSANQLWQIMNGAYNGAFQLQNPVSGRCVTAEGGGTYTDIWDCYGTAYSPHQSWVLRLIPYDNYISQGWMFRSKAYGTCLAVDSASTADGATLKLEPCAPSKAHQRWNTYWSTTGQKMIKNIGTGKCLTAASASTANGVRITQWTCDSNYPSHYKWVWPFSVNNGGWDAALVNVNSGRCMTAEGTGAYTDQWDCVGASHQLWDTLGASFFQQPFGGACAGANDCLSNSCVSGTCGKAANYLPCQTANDCTSGICDFGYCGV